MKETHGSARLILGTITAAVVSASSCTHVSTRPVMPPPATAMRLIVQPLRPAATATPAGYFLRASWYGPGLAGRKTSSGETFNPRALTAASRTLPIGSVLKVTNPRNGKSVKVKVNDRGPFVAGRGLDLSRRAAEEIGIIHEGVAAVEVTSTTPSATDLHGVKLASRGR
jgi:rare lipoprotein A